MRTFGRPWFVTACLVILAGSWFFAEAVIAAEPADSSPKYTINQRTYLWLLPQFWMSGTKSFAYIRIENPLNRAISFYLHCRTQERTITGMTGRFTLRPGAVKVVDSRNHDIGDGAALTHCSLKSHDKAKIQYMIRDGRVRNYGDHWKLIRPEIS